MTRNESDSAWKDLLDIYLKDFFDYCLPAVSAQIDWSRPWTSLDKEFQSITKGESGKRLVDKLFKVYRKDGMEQWVLIHIEVQNEPEKEFPQRMFTYHYRIYDRYQQPIVSCAILTDDHRDWRPAHYTVGFAGSYIKSEFLVVKPIDYIDKIDELESSNNPFASVILIQLEMLKNKSRPVDQRKQAKFALTKRLYDKKYSKTDIINLYRFIDWLIGLPEPLELEYLDYVHQLEEAKRMPYISTAERLGMERGIEKGIEQGIERGIQKGIAKGIEKEKIIVAQRLLAEGVEPVFIAKITDLSLLQIKEFQQKS